MRQFLTRRDVIIALSILNYVILVTSSNPLIPWICGVALFANGWSYGMADLRKKIEDDDDIDRTS